MRDQTIISYVSLRCDEFAMRNDEVKTLALSEFIQACMKEQKKKRERERKKNCCNRLCVFITRSLINSKSVTRIQKLSAMVPRRLMLHLWPHWIELCPCSLFIPKWINAAYANSVLLETDISWIFTKKENSDSDSFLTIWPIYCL